MIWVLRLVKIIALILSRVNLKVGQKREIPETNHLITLKQNFACLTCDPSWAGTLSGQWNCLEGKTYIVYSGIFYLLHRCWHHSKI